MVFSLAKVELKSKTGDGSVALTGLAGTLGYFSQGSALLHVMFPPHIGRNIAIQNLNLLGYKPRIVKAQL